MKAKHSRMAFYGVALVLIGGAIALVLAALEENIVFFRSPSDIVAEAPPDRPFRLGGLVAEGSVERATGSSMVRFAVTDGANTVPVRFEGLLPDLFREGQGVVAEGRLAPDGVFTASEVLAKHDENYMPPEVVEALQKAGQWKGEDAQ